MAFRAADTVTHQPSGETWVLACDQRGADVLPAGWPETLAKADDCALVEAASDEERRQMLERVAKLGTYRGGVARSQLAALVLVLGVLLFASTASAQSESLILPRVSPLNPWTLPNAQSVVFRDTRPMQILRVGALGVFLAGATYDTWQAGRPTPAENFDLQLLAMQGAYLGGLGILTWNAASSFRRNHPKLTPWLQIGVAAVQVGYGINRAKWGRRWDRLRDAQEK